MAKQMSYVEALDVVLQNGEMTEQVAERLEALKASLQKRNSHKAGPTKAQKENMALVEKIFEAMEPNVVYTTVDIGKLIPELEGASSQRVSALMRKLVNSERVTSVKVKGKANYQLA